MHHTCACLHWWSPEVTSPARRAFPGTKGKLERDGLSHVGSPPWISFLGNSAPWKGWPATVLFSPALPHVTRTGQNCYLSSSIKALAWPVGYPLPFKTMKPSLSSSLLAYFERCWLPFFSLKWLSPFNIKVANTLGLTSNLTSWVQSSLDFFFFFFLVIMVWRL